MGDNEGGQGPLFQYDQLSYRVIFRREETDLDRCHEVLDDWFDDGEFTALTRISSVAMLLRFKHPEFKLSRDEAIGVVKTWFDCARDMGEID